MREARKNVKFIQIVSPDIFSALKAIAKERGIGIQELIRGLVIPDWLERYYSSEEMRRLRIRRRTGAKRDRSRLPRPTAVPVSPKRQ